MRASPIHSFLAAQGGRFFDYHGWSIARDFGDFAGEYQAVRECVGLVDFSHLTKLRAVGADARDYFHRRLSNRVNSLKNGEGVQACLLQGNGKLLAELSVYARADELLLVSSPLLRESLLEECRRYLIAEDCTISDVSEEFLVLSLQGRRAEEFVERALGGNFYPRTAWHHVEAECCGVALTLIRVDLIDLPGFHLLMRADAAVQAIEQIEREVRRFGGRLVGFEAYQTLRIEAGQPVFGHELDQDVLPPEANLNQALDFEKGCYPGQEVMARLRNFGHPARLLVGLSLDSNEPPAPGCPVTADGTEVGRITSSAFSPRMGRAVALAYLKWDFHAPGPELRAGRTRAVIRPLPLAKN